VTAAPSARALREDTRSTMRTVEQLLTRMDKEAGRIARGESHTVNFDDLNRAAAAAIGNLQALAQALVAAETQQRQQLETRRQPA
jgi:hypothetical protein